jgi:hypothetical protein
LLVPFGQRQRTQACSISLCDHHPSVHQRVCVDVTICIISRNGYVLSASASSLWVIRDKGWGWGMGMFEFMYERVRHWRLSVHLSVLLCCHAVTGHDGARSCHWAWAQKIFSITRFLTSSHTKNTVSLTAKTTLFHLDRCWLPSAWSHICIQKNLRILIPCSLVDEHFAAPSTVTYFHALSSARQLLWTWMNGTKVPALILLLFMEDMSKYAAPVCLLLEN